MPPDWPNKLSTQEIEFAGSAFNWDVSEGHMLQVLNVPKHDLQWIEYGKKHERLDRKYGSRSTFAAGLTYDGRLVYIGLRFDKSGATSKRCWVFHAEYL